MTQKSRKYMENKQTTHRQHIDNTQTTQYVDTHKKDIDRKQTRHRQHMTTHRPDIDNTYTIYRKEVYKKQAQTRHRREIDQTKTRHRKKERKKEGKEIYITLLIALFSFGILRLYSVHSMKHCCHCTGCPFRHPSVSLYLGLSISLNIQKSK